MRLAIWVSGLIMRAGTSLSVPFSSGCALQLVLVTPRGAVPSLSVPFSSGCALQFLCDILYTMVINPLSVPFSSGCALQFESKPSTWSTFKFFQFPFHRDAPCNGCYGTTRKSGLGFQFPFHRDAPCNRSKNFMSDKNLDSFSSLFIGMRLAID